MDGKQYGDAPAEELESVKMRKLGWPISNQLGTRVRPGRDGWQRWFGYFGETKDGEPNPRWLTSQVPASQHLPAEPQQINKD